MKQTTTLEDLILESLTGIAIADHGTVREARIGDNYTFTVILYFDEHHLEIDLDDVICETEEE